MQHCYRVAAYYGVNLMHICSWEVSGVGGEVPVLHIFLVSGAEIAIPRDELPEAHDQLHRILMNEYQALTAEGNPSRPRRIK